MLNYIFPKKRQVANRKLKLGQNPSFSSEIIQKYLLRHKFHFSLSKFYISSLNVIRTDVMSIICQPRPPLVCYVDTMSAI